MVQAEPGAVTLVCNKVLGLGGDGSSPCIPNATSLFLATFDSPEVEDLGLVMELLFFVRTPCPPPPPRTGWLFEFSPSPHLLGLHLRVCAHPSGHSLLLEMCSLAAAMCPAKCYCLWNGEDEYQRKACHKQGDLKPLPGAVASVEREVRMGSDFIAASQQLCGLECTQLPAVVCTFTECG